jgi:hypothetical protein
VGAVEAAALKRPESSQGRRTRPDPSVVETPSRPLGAGLEETGALLFSPDALPPAGWHPHGHLLTTDGGFREDGAFHRLESWDADAVMKLFRERLLARLVERHAISEELARKLVAWTHPGFSSHIAAAIPFENKKAIEDLACHLVRAPFSLQKLVYLDGHKAVLYRSRMNPPLGRNFEAMDPLEWLARLADHIPDPGRHRTHFYAHYANRVRGERPGEEEPRHSGEAEPPPRRRCSSTWARLIAKVYQVDPLVHLGLSTPPQDKPPPQSTGERHRNCERMSRGWGDEGDETLTGRSHASSRFCRFDLCPRRCFASPDVDQHIRLSSPESGTPRDRREAPGPENQHGRHAGRGQDNRRRYNLHHMGGRRTIPLLSSRFLRPRHDGGRGCRICGRGHSDRKPSRISRRRACGGFLGYKFSMERGFTAETQIGPVYLWGESAETSEWQTLVNVKVGWSF